MDNETQEQQQPQLFEYPFVKDDIRYFSSALYQSVEIIDLLKAMVKFSDSLKAIKKDSSAPKFKKSPQGYQIIGQRQYISLDAILDFVRPLLAKQGLFVTQEIADDTIVTTLYHESGQFKSSVMALVSIDSTMMNSIQKLGAGITYRKRYALSALLGISSEEDTDGMLDKDQTNGSRANAKDKKASGAQWNALTKLYKTYNGEDKDEMSRKLNDLYKERKLTSAEASKLIDKLKASQMTKEEIKALEAEQNQETK